MVTSEDGRIVEVTLCGVGGEGKMETKERGWREETGEGEERESRERAGGERERRERREREREREGGGGMSEREGGWA